MNLKVRLQNLACFSPFLLVGGVKSTKSRLLEHLSNTLTGSSGALEVSSVNPISNSLTLRMTRLEPFFPAQACLSHTSSTVTGPWFVFLSSSITLGSFRRSFLQPTKNIGMFGQKCVTSYIHYTRKLVERSHRLEHWFHASSSTFFSDSGESMAKQIRMTWVSG